MRELPHSSGCSELGQLDFLGFGSGSEDGQPESEEEEGQDLLAALMGADLFAEPSGGSSSCGAGASSTAPAGQPDWCRLAGAVAAAGVLLPQPLAGSGGSGCAMHTASSGSTSGCEGSGAAGGSPGPLGRQRSLLLSSDIGCLAAVTLRFMHQPGECGAGLCMFGFVAHATRAPFNVNLTQHILLLWVQSGWWKARALLCATAPPAGWRPLAMCRRPLPLLPASREASEPPRAARPAAPNSCIYLLATCMTLI